MSEEEFDYLFKCIAVGDGGCGKTALVVRFSQGFFQENYKMTIGVEFAVKSIEVKNQAGRSYNTKIQIWDTGGQDRFQYVRPLYYRGAMGTILLFDLTNRESYDHIPRWIDEVSKNTGDIPMLMVGNKRDLVHERVVSREEAEALAQKLDIFYIETSAKDGSGVGDVFAILALLMIGDDIPPDLFSKNKVVSKIVPSHDTGLPQPKPLPMGNAPAKLTPKPLVTRVNSQNLTPRPKLQPLSVKSEPSIKITQHKSDVTSQGSPRSARPVHVPSPQESEANWFAPSPPKKRTESPKELSSNLPPFFQSQPAVSSEKSKPKPKIIPHSSSAVDNEYFAPAPPPKSESGPKKIVIKARPEAGASDITKNPFFSRAGSKSGGEKPATGQQGFSIKPVSAIKKRVTPPAIVTPAPVVERPEPVNQSPKIIPPQINPVIGDTKSTPEIKSEPKSNSNLTSNPFFNSSLKKAADVEISERSQQSEQVTSQKSVLVQKKVTKAQGKYDSFLDALKNKEPPVTHSHSQNLTSLFQSTESSQKTMNSKPPKSNVSNLISSNPPVITPGMPKPAGGTKFNFCGKCGSKLNKSFKFCNKCGAKME